MHISPTSRSLMGRTILFLCLICLTLIFLPLPAPADTPAKSKPKAKIEEKIEKKIARWKAATKAGSVTAPYLLGRAYHEGLGVRKSETEAFRLYTLGTGRGDQQAALALADLYLAGEGTPRDEEKAISWYLKLGAGNSKYARPARTRLLMLTKDYALGENGVKQDEVKTRALFLRLLAMEQEGQAKSLPSHPPLVKGKGRTPAMK